MSEFYSNERIIGHHISVDYEISEGKFLGGKKHNIRITEGDIGWNDTQEVVLTPEEIVALYDSLIENHLDDLEQLAENKATLIEGAERSEMAKRLLNNE